MLDSLPQFVPSLAQLAGLGAVLISGFALLALGAAVGGSRRLWEADIIAGWGITTLVFIIAGTLAPLSLGWVAAGLLLAAAVCAVVAAGRDGFAAGVGPLRAMLLGLPLLIIASAMMASQWDEFSQWLWNARYLLEVGAFPGPGRPESLASFPAYPKAMPIAMALNSWVAGTFVENGGALFNLVLLLATALLVARLMRLGYAPQEPDRAPGFALLAFALLFTIAFPPFVVAKITLTAYADPGTAVAVAFSAILGWRAVLALADDERRAQAAPMGWQMGLAMAVLVSLKQANLVLLILIFIGVALAGLRTTGVRPAALAGLLARAILPAAIAYFLWRHYVGQALSGAEFKLISPADWDLSVIRPMLATIFSIMLNKSVFFAAMVLVAIFAPIALIRDRGPLGALAIISGTIFAGYLAFLLFIYVAAFGGSDARNALSFWRYMMHTGALGAVTWAYILGVLWRRQARPDLAPAWGKAVILLALIFPLAMAPKLRFDLRSPKIYVRSVSHELFRLIPEGARVIIVDPLDAGFYGKLMRYMLYRHVLVVQSMQYSPSADAIQTALANTHPTYAWIHTQSDAVRRVFGALLPPGSSYLMKKEVAGWRLIESWPYPGYALPSDIPD